MDRKRHSLPPPPPPPTSSSYSIFNAHPSIRSFYDRLLLELIQNRSKLFYSLYHAVVNGAPGTAEFTESSNGRNIFYPNSSAHWPGLPQYLAQLETGNVSIISSPSEHLQSYSSSTDGFNPQSLVRKMINGLNVQLFHYHSIEDLYFCLPITHIRRADPWQVPHRNPSLKQALDRQWRCKVDALREEDWDSILLRMALLPSYFEVSLPDRPQSERIPLRLRTPLNLSHPYSHVILPLSPGVCVIDVGSPMETVFLSFFSF